MGPVSGEIKTELKQGFLAAGYQHMQNSPAITNVALKTPRHFTWKIIALNAPPFSPNALDMAPE